MNDRYFGELGTGSTNQASSWNKDRNLMNKKLFYTDALKTIIKLVCVLDNLGLYIRLSCVCVPTVTKRI